jgi:four helix bundle protein
MKQFNQSNQFQRSSSSIGANIAEATRAASRRDFVNKLRIASKELSETQYWLKLFKASKDFPDTTELYKMSIEIEYMLNKSISTAIKNGRNK